MTNFIDGDLNPFAISSIRLVRGKRYGAHPMKSRLYKKKHPIKSKIFNPFETSLFDGWWRPSVRINGPDGDELRRIAVRSNDEGRALVAKLRGELDTYLGSLRKGPIPWA